MLPNLSQPAKLVASIDGAARGNPGPASAGVVIRREGAADAIQISHFLGRRTNNQAEYEALVIALEEIDRIPRQGSPIAMPDELVIRTDSELLFCQMTGQYRIRDRELARLAQKAHRLISRLSRVTFQRVPRAQNKEADLLANQALDREERRSRVSVRNE